MSVLFFGFLRQDTAGRRGEADTVMMYIQPTTPSVEDLMNEKVQSLGPGIARRPARYTHKDERVREGKTISCCKHYNRCTDFPEKIE
jgi:hypothetical protein